MTKLHTSLIDWTSSEEVTLSLQRRGALREFPADANVATQQVCMAPWTLGIWYFKFACFLTINSLKTTHMYTFEDIKRIFISESGIEQILRRTRIVIPQSNTFGYRSTRKLLLIIATGFHCWKPLKGMTTTSPVNHSFEDMITSWRNMEFSHDWCKRSLARKSAQSKITRELLHHGRRAGKEEKIEIRVVSGETNLIIHSLHKANVFILLKYL